MPDPGFFILDRGKPTMRAQLRCQKGIRTPESKILSACLKYLSLHIKVAWTIRMNVGAALDSQGNYIRFGVAGMPDILGQLKDGRVLAIEVKAPGKHPTVLQKAFLDKVSNYNGVACCVHDIYELEKMLNHQP